MRQLTFGKILFLAIFVFAFLFALSSLAMGLGDKLLLKDKIPQAGILYNISKITNPLNKDIEKRLLAVRVITDERNYFKELSFDEKEELKIYKNVLGASATVPVLMYHYIRINPDPNDRVGFNLSVTPANFAAQMDYLASIGYQTISPDELGAFFLNNAALPSKPIIISFDDGYADSYSSALPILRSHGFKAVNFVTTGLIEVPGYLTWGQIEEMKNSGVFTFGSHSVHHWALTYLTDDRIRYEVSESKNILGSHLGYPINWFAYPYGNVNNQVIKVLQQAGYMGAFGTNLGTSQLKSALFTLPRIRIGGGDSVSSFASKLPWKS